MRQLYIPGNPLSDNLRSLRCIQVIAGVLGRAGEEGQATRRGRARRGEIRHRQEHGLVAPLSTETKETIPNGPSPERIAELRRIEAERSQLLTSKSPEGLRSGADASFEEELMRIYYQADMTNFEDDAPFERLVELLNGNKDAAQSPATKEMFDRIRAAREDAGLDPDVPAIRRERIDPESAKFYEKEVARMMSHKTTQEEREAIAKQEGNEAAKTPRGMRWADVIRRKQQAKDEGLAKLVAAKRRELGETFSDEDRKVLGLSNGQNKSKPQSTASAKPQQHQGEQVSEPAGEEGITDGAFVEAYVEEKRTEPTPSSTDSKKGE